MPDALPSAYSFVVDKTFRWRVRHGLDRRGPWDSWTWKLGDSAWLGDYDAAKPLPHDGVIRIYEEDGRFVLVILYHSERTDALADYQRLHAMLVDEFLPAIGATDVRPHPGLDVRGEGFHGPSR
jgi:hypothetical protein